MDCGGRLLIFSSLALPSLFWSSFELDYPATEVLRNRSLGRRLSRVTEAEQASSWASYTEVAQELTEDEWWDRLVMSAVSAA